MKHSEYKVGDFVECLVDIDNGIFSKGQIAVVNKLHSDILRTDVVRLGHKRMLHWWVATKDIKKIPYWKRGDLK